MFEKVIIKNANAIGVKQSTHEMEMLLLSGSLSSYSHIIVLLLGRLAKFMMLKIGIWHAWLKIEEALLLIYMNIL